MILDYNRTAAYACPFCSMISQHTVSIFDFSGGASLSLNCAGRGCGEHCASIIPRGKKYRIDAECPVCMETHSFYIPKEKLWTNSVLTLKCPESGIGIFFLGKPSAVKDKLREHINIYNELFDEYYGEDDEDLPDDDFDEDEIILHGIAERLEMMIHLGSVKCSCGSTNVAMNIRNGFVTAECRDCGKHLSIPADEHTLMQLMNIKTFVIK